MLLYSLTDSSIVFGGTIFAQIWLIKDPVSVTVAFKHMYSVMFITVIFISSYSIWGKVKSSFSFLVLVNCVLLTWSVQLILQLYWPSARLREKFWLTELLIDVLVWFIFWSNTRLQFATCRRLSFTLNEKVTFLVALFFQVSFRGKRRFMVGAVLSMRIVCTSVWLLLPAWSNIVV